MDYDPSTTSQVLDSESDADSEKEVRGFKQLPVVELRYIFPFKTLNEEELNLPVGTLVAYDEKRTSPNAFSSLAWKTPFKDGCRAYILATADSGSETSYRLINIGWVSVERFPELQRKFPLHNYWKKEGTIEIAETEEGIFIREGGKTTSYPLSSLDISPN